MSERGSSCCCCRPRGPVKVCFVAPAAYPLLRAAPGRSHGGAEVDAWMIATELAADERFEVSMIVGEYGQSAEERVGGIGVLKSPGLSRRTGALGLWRAMARADAEVYFRKGASLVTVVTAAFCRLRGRRFMFRSSNSGECDGTYIRGRMVRGRLYRWALRQAEAVFVQNRSDVQAMADSVGVPALHVPNAHRLDAAPPAAARRTVLWVGRNTPEKRPEKYVELAAAVPEQAFVMVCNRSKDGEPLAAGPRPANLEFHEHVAFAEIGRLFAEAKVLVSTSVTEGFPNTFIQAGACGTAILSVRVDPDGMLAQGGCGVRCGEDGELAPALRGMLEGERYAEFGWRAREYVREHHDLAKVVERYKAVILGGGNERSGGGCSRASSGTTCT